MIMTTTTMTMTTMMMMTKTTIMTMTTMVVTMTMMTATMTIMMMMMMTCSILRAIETARQSVSTACEVHWDTLGSRTSWGLFDSEGDGGGTLHAGMSRARVGEEQAGSGGFANGAEDYGLSRSDPGGSFPSISGRLTRRELEITERHPARVID